MLKYGGLSVERDALTHWPFTSCLACSIFNVSQLTAAHTGSLVRNATHATTPAWQAHALVVLLLKTGLPNTPGGGGGDPYSACDWVWRYWSDWDDICISPAGYALAGAGWPLLPPLVAGPPGPGRRARRRGAGFPCGCSPTGLTQQWLHYGPHYTSRWLSGGSVWLTCTDKMMSGLRGHHLLLNREE